MATKEDLTAIKNDMATKEDLTAIKNDMVAMEKRILDAFKQLITAVNPPRPPSE